MIGLALIAHHLGLLGIIAQIALVMAVVALTMTAIWMLTHQGEWS